MKTSLAVIAYSPAAAFVIAWLLPQAARALGLLTVTLLVAAVVGLVVSARAVARGEKPRWVFGVAAVLNVTLGILLGGTLVFIGAPA